jgi:hypothetical protein
VSNSGGQPGQWYFTLGGSGFSLSSASGTLNPGQRTTVTVTSTQVKPHDGTISVLLAPGTRFTVYLTAV